MPQDINKWAPNTSFNCILQYWGQTIPLCCFSPFCPLSWVLGVLADNSHKSSDLGEKLLVNTGWDLTFQDWVLTPLSSRPFAKATEILPGFLAAPLPLRPSLSMPREKRHGRGGSWGSYMMIGPLKNYSPFWNPILPYVKSSIIQILI